MRPEAKVVLVTGGGSGIGRATVRRFVQPIPRAASPEEMASTVLFLAGDESAFYTGQTLSPNGGMWM